MDCCDNTKQERKKENREESMKGGKKMKIKKSTLMWIAIGALFLAVLFLTYKASNITGNAVAGDSGKLDTSGWSENEKMNYEMHGTIPARLQGKAAASSGSSGAGMVGGC